MLARVTRLLLMAGMVAFAAPALSADLTLNLKGADLTTLVETVAQATGHNFILDPQIKGKVTVISSKPMTEKDLYRMFLSILEVHGYIAVPTDNGAIKIIPDTEMKYSGAPRPNETTDGSEVVTRVFKLKSVSAAKVLGALRPLASPKAHMASYDDGNMLIVSDHADVVERLAVIVSRVDQADEGGVETIVLRNASAVEVARVINALEQGQPAAAGQPAGQTARQVAVADERTNSILLGGDQATKVKLRTIISHLDTPVEVRGNTRVEQLKHANAKKMVDVLVSMGQDYLKNTQKEKKVEATGLVNVQAYEGTNALVITAPPALLQSMQDVIKRLDVRQTQVQVEAIIVEVSVTKAADLGVQWGVLGGRGDNKGVVGGTNLPTSNGPGLVQLGGLIAKGAADAATGLAPTSGLLIGGTNGDNFVGLLRALNGDGSSNVLSTPTVVTLDNEEAEIMVGKRMSVSTGQTSTLQGGNPFTTIARENVGLTLKVRPQISEGDVVRLEIHQEVSEIGLVDSFGNRDTNNRAIKTSVLVDDQQVLVLGGLISSDRKMSNKRVPILGDIPLLGMLFQVEEAVDEKKNLMVFLRPTILRTREDGIHLTHEKYRAMREQQLDAPRGRGPVTLTDQPPLLPEIGGLRMERGLGGADRLSGDSVPARPLVRPSTVREESLEKPPVDEPPVKKESRPSKPTPGKGKSASGSDKPAVKTPKKSPKSATSPATDENRPEGGAYSAPDAGRQSGLRQLNGLTPRVSAWRDSQPNASDHVN
ncbi:MAG: type II secretion system secretin GspD [Magnetococcales bacterium]|nr:type II secretion system secretin GspD [Magnetococcales bacterium]